ncbi:MAG TPA: hypothetical protein VGH65_07560 [Verrucomicrobiaceae bacterium]
MSNKANKKEAKPGPKKSQARTELSDDQLEDVTGGGASLPGGCIVKKPTSTGPTHPPPPKFPPTIA